MKKIGIVTLVHVRNLGAGLQAYAMQHLLKKRGCEVVFLKGYDRKTSKELFSWDLNIRFPSCLKPKNFKFLFDKIVKFERSFSKFSEKKLTKKEVKSCDHIILGSDSIWMPKVIESRMDPTFFGAIPHKSISSYAASSGGKSDIALYDEKQLKPLKRLKYVTVRDESTRKVVKDATGRDATIVLDPTLLIDWYEVLKLEKMDKRPVKEKYILLYGWFPASATIAVRKYAKKNNLKTISVGLLTGGADVVKAVSPLEFIQYLAYAEEVVTCMFHGVMLSLAMQKQFRYVPQDPNRDMKVATTMDSIHVDQADYYWYPETEKLKFGVLNYEMIDALRKEMVDESVAWIDKMIDN